ncbi:MAG: rod shape-determining protein RodA [Cyclobacteriaceae bacterium]
MSSRGKIWDRIDWITVILYLILVFWGWFNIYAAVYDEELAVSMFSLSTNSGKQLIWIGTSFLLILGVMMLDFKFYDSFSYVFYALMILLLLAVLGTGTIVSGSKSWFQVGGFRLQPSEFTKFATALAIAKFLGTVNVKLDNAKNQLIAAGLIGVPIVLIILQGDLGSAMVFGAFVLVYYREGLSPILFALGLGVIALFIVSLLVDQTLIFIVTGSLALIFIGLSIKNFKKILVIIGMAVFVVGMVKSVDFIMTDVLKPHQRNRVVSLFNPDADPLGVGWNVTQSKIAIGSGGVFGKGFLNGTQTKYDFVPEQSTDFIFCTLGEEHGWVGSVLLITLFSILLVRISIIAERQKSRFARVYGYGVLAVLFFHFMVNIAMTIGLFPVIGIPLPFFSYGGSSLWSFTILLFILLNLDAHRMQVLMH